jgi:hypothetical protein
MIEFKHGRVTLKMWPDFTKDEVEAVIGNLRATDQYEATALGEDAEQAVVRCRQIVGSTPVSYMAYLDGAPVFLFGVTAFNAQHVALWGFGTDGTRQAIPAVTRYVRRQWLKTLRQAGVSRIEARLPTSCRDSLQWLKSCGMRVECELAGATATGEPLSQLSYTWNHT